MPKNKHLGEQPLKVLELHVAKLWGHTSILVNSMLPTNYEPPVTCGLHIANKQNQTSDEPHVVSNVKTTSFMLPRW